MHRMIKGKDGISKETWPLEARTISSEKALHMEDADHKHNLSEDYWKYCLEFNLSGSNPPSLVTVSGTVPKGHVT